MGRLSHLLPFHSLARGGATKRDAPVRPIAWELRNLPSARLNLSITRNPHGRYFARMQGAHSVHHTPHGHTPSVIGNDLDLVRTGVGPHEAQPPLIVDAHAPLPSPITPERFKPIAWR
jgi:hypothetical protein